MSGRFSVGWIVCWIDGFGVVNAIKALPDFATRCRILWPAIPGPYLNDTRTGAEILVTVCFCTDIHVYLRAGLSLARE
jgi:hypothetical protein